MINKRLNTPAANETSHINPERPLIARAKLCEYTHFETVIVGIKGSISEFVISHFWYRE
jgi:hypothetical protein